MYPVYEIAYLGVNFMGQTGNLPPTNREKKAKNENKKDRFGKIFYHFYT